MNKHRIQVTAVVSILMLMPVQLLQARGRGGGGISRGGGMSRPSMGGARPSFSGGSSFNRPSMNRSPSYSRPPVSRPSNISRPPVSRPSTSRPSISSSSRVRTPGSVTLPRSSSTSRVGDRQIGSVNRTPGNRVGDRQIGTVDRTPANRVGDRQPGSVNRTGRDVIGRATIPGLSAAGGATVGSRLSSDMQSQLSARRGQIQQTRESGAYRDGLQNRFENRDEMVASRRDQLQNRIDNRPDNIDDRREYRDNVREDRQDYRDDVRDDWQRYNDNNPWNDHWDHDHWHDHFKDHWDHMWEEHPVWATYRVTQWGMNRASYLFGYGPVYYNPYPVEPYYVGSTVIDYSQPLVTSAPLEQYVPMDAYAAEPGDPGAAATDPIPSEPSSKAVESFDAARAAFNNGSYEEALKLCDAAIGELPKDATLHEFRSLILFALGRYRESAAAVHAVLAVGPGMNWTTMSGFYADQAEYTQQFRALEKHIEQNRNEADARFLLAYHYITLGHNSPAIQQLKAVLSLQPKDDVAADLLQMLGGELPKATPATAPQPELSKGTEEELLGSWKAESADGTFGLTLSKDGSFSWSYAKGNTEQTIKGVFIIDDGVLAMEPDSGGVMLADVSKPENDRFTFRQNGTGAGSITFQRQ